MKLIRLALLSIFFLFAVASFIGMLLPAHVLVSRAVNITAPSDSIRPLLTDIREWKKWIDGMDQSSVHISSSTHADLAGSNVSITGISDTTVVSRWVSKTGTRQTATLRTIADPAQHVTVVQWQFEETLKWYPWQRLGSMMNDKILGPMMEKNLNNLKTLLENSNAH